MGMLGESYKLICQLYPGSPPQSVFHKIPSNEYSKKYPSAPDTRLQDKLVVCSNPLAGFPNEVEQVAGAAGATHDGVLTVIVTDLQVVLVPQAEA